MKNNSLFVGDILLPSIKTPLGITIGYLKEPCEFRGLISEEEFESIGEKNIIYAPEFRNRTVTSIRKASDIGEKNMLCFLYNIYEGKIYIKEFDEIDYDDLFECMEKELEESESDDEGEKGDGVYKCDCKNCNDEIEETIETETKEV